VTEEELLVRLAGLRCATVGTRWAPLATGPASVEPADAHAAPHPVFGAAHPASAVSASTWVRSCGYIALAGLGTPC
jgi:hypothetical protein